MSSLVIDNKSHVFHWSERFSHCYVLLIYQRYTDQRHEALVPVIPEN